MKSDWVVVHTPSVYHVTWLYGKIRVVQVPSYLLRQYLSKSLPDEFFLHDVCSKDEQSFQNLGIWARQLTLRSKSRDFGETKVGKEGTLVTSVWSSRAFSYVEISRRLVVESHRVSI